MYLEKFMPSIVESRSVLLQPKDTLHSSTFSYRQTSKLRNNERERKLQSHLFEHGKYQTFRLYFAVNVE